METNNKASTSHVTFDLSDEDDQRHENISTEQLVYLKVKTFRNLCFENQNQVKISVKIDWLDMRKIEEILKKYNPGKKNILPGTLQKWNPLDNISDPHSILSDVVFKFDFLKYAEIKPYWWACHENLEKDSVSETSNSYQNSNDCSQTIVDTISEAMETDYAVPEKWGNENDEKMNDKLANLDLSGEIPFNKCKQLHYTN